MSKKNLYNKEAIEKLSKIAEDTRFCMMATLVDGDKPLLARPMTVQEVDDDGMVWFISSKDGDKDYKVENNSDIQLLFSNTSKHEYMSLYGKVTIHTDQETIDKHWSKMAESWFDSKEDDNISILEIEPKDIKYWSTENGKLVSSVLMLYSALTGDDSVDPGVSGKLKI